MSRSRRSAPVNRQVLLVTGGTRGIGAAVARAAHARGHAVCVAYVSDDA